MSSSTEILEGSEVAELPRRCRGFMGVNVWDLYARVYDFLPRYVRQYQRLLADVLSAVERNTTEGGKVLDSGCGTGNFSLALGRRGYDVEGIDISPAMLQRARLKKKQAGLRNVDFREWDIGRGLTLYPDATFDCVVSINALYALQNPEAAIREYLRVLKPSGHFILAEPQSSIKIIPIIKEIYREGGVTDVVKVFMTQSGVGIFNLLIRKRLREGSYHYWDKGKLGNMLRRAGFRTESIVPTYIAGLDLQATAVKPRYYFEMNGHKFLSAESCEDLDKAWRLRYQVYCVELGIEPENDRGIERDAYDDYAINFLAMDENDRAVGTIRFVYNNPIGYPMDPDFPLTDYLKKHSISRAIEIGRFVIHKDVPRDNHLTIAMGLLKCLYEYSCDTATYDVFAVTKPKLIGKYQMAGVEVLGEPFRHSKPLYKGWWVSVHANIIAAREGYKHYSRTGQVPGHVA